VDARQLATNDNTGDKKSRVISPTFMKRRTTPTDDNRILGIYLLSFAIITGPECRVADLCKAKK